MVGALLTAAARVFLIMVAGHFLYGIGIGLVSLLCNTLLYVIFDITNYITMETLILMRLMRVAFLGLCTLLQCISAKTDICW